MTTAAAAKSRVERARPPSTRIDVEAVRIEPARPASDASEAAAWDAFVEVQPEAGLGHLAGARRLSDALGRDTDRSLVARTPEGRIVAVFPLFETTVPVLRHLRRRTLGTGRLLPSGPLVDGALSDKDRDRLAERLHHAARDVAIGLEADDIVVAMPGVVRGRPVAETHPVSPLLRYWYRPAPRAGLILDVAPTPDELFAAMDSACRSIIRRCRREPVTAKLLDDRDAWLRCQPYSMQYDGPNRFPVPFFEVLWDDFVARGRAVPSAVVAPGEDGREEVLSVVLMSVFAGSAYYWFSFAKQPIRPPGANNVALWEAIVAARERGARVVELGSLEFVKGKEAAISRFKQAFGGKPYVGWAGTKELRPARRAVLDLGDAVVEKARRTAARLRPAPAAGASSAD